MTDQTMTVEASRVLPVSPTDAFAAFTTPDPLARWWGPAGFTGSVVEADFREGGSTLTGMTAPPEYGGATTYNLWSYSRVEPPLRLEYTMRFATPEGAPLSPADAGVPPGVPDGVPHVVTFEPVDGGTRVTVVESGYAAGPGRDGSQMGLDQCMDKLVDLFRSEP
jgi:uncharacterized protein YndB with AHSA1/START domain